MQEERQILLELGSKILSSRVSLQSLGFYVAKVANFFATRIGKMLKNLERRLTCIIFITATKKNVGKSKNIGAGVLHITVMAIRNHKICMYISITIRVPSILINLQYYVKLFPFRRLLCKNTTARFQMASVLYLFMTRAFFSPLLIILTCNIPLGKLKNCTEHSDLALKWSASFNVTFFITTKAGSWKRKMQALKLWENWGESGRGWLPMILVSFFTSNSSHLLEKQGNNSQSNRMMMEFSYISAMQMEKNTV